MAKRWWVGLFMVGWAGMPQAEAKLEFAAPVQAIPAKWSDTQVVAVYKFKNTGNTTVKVTDLKSSCECTVPKLAKREYAPGESGELVAEFTVGTREGPQSKTITLTTDLADQPLVMLIFKTDIPYVPGLDRPLLTWNIGKPAAPQTLAVTLPPDMPVEQIDVTPKDSFFSAEVKTVEPGRRYAVILTPKTLPAIPAHVVLTVAVKLKDGTVRSRTTTLMVLPGQ